MSRALIQLKHEGQDVNKQSFTAIYGEYSIGTYGYAIGNYMIPFTNIASVYAGEVEDNKKGTLVIT